MSIAMRKRIESLEEKSIDRMFQQYLEKIKGACDNWQAIEAAKGLTDWWASIGGELDVSIIEAILTSFKPELQAVIRGKLSEIAASMQEN